ncbi:hypothetical protein [Burkholderia cepacia]|uniref:hypothetical protein n=1 Tax=Burkholderia cepacia TaxID=292 RepID=UPI00398ED577
MDDAVRAGAGRRFASGRGARRATRSDAIARAFVAAEAAIAWLPANLATVASATGAAAHGAASRDGTRGQATIALHAFAPGARMRSARRMAEPVVAKRMPLP